MRHGTASRALVHDSGFMFHGFTLLELLITLGIISILTGVLVSILNPVELLKKARDTRRIQDLDSIHNALLLYQTEIPAGSFGATTSVSVSVPDTSGTCANLGLPTLPTGYSYRCVTSVNLQKTDGNGWIPVNFGALSVTMGSNPLPYLPIDPQNTTSTGSYYTYIPGGSWEITSRMEAASNRGTGTQADKDGGYSSAYYEKGTDLALALTPSMMLNHERVSDGRYLLPNGLSGYWAFDEGSGSTTNDSSGNGYSGSLVSSPSWVTGKVGGALQYDGSTSYTQFQSLPNLSDWTITAWGSASSLANVRNTIFGVSQYMALNLKVQSTSIETTAEGNGYVCSPCGSQSTATSTWYFYALTCDGSTNRVTISINTNLIYNNIPSYTCLQLLGKGNGGGSVFTFRVGAGGSPSNQRYAGTVDDVRVYNRTLPTTEVQALYNATR